MKGVRDKREKGGKTIRSRRAPACQKKGICDSSSRWFDGEDEWGKGMKGKSTEEQG